MTRRFRSACHASACSAARSSSWARSARRCSARAIGSDVGEGALKTWHHPSGVQGLVRRDTAEGASPWDATEAVADRWEPCSALGVLVRFARGRHFVLNGPSGTVPPTFGCHSSGGNPAMATGTQPSASCWIISIQTSGRQLSANDRPMIGHGGRLTTAAAQVARAVSQITAAHRIPRQHTGPEAGAMSCRVTALRGAAESRSGTRSTVGTPATRTCHMRTPRTSACPIGTSRHGANPPFICPSNRQNIRTLAHSGEISC
ncbi:hypothetical protein SAMN04489729_0830 [Amycolatopsis lurida]|nr:hypothetical protein SAMN04489729_0830 [Amycolatopsis lurida]